MLFTRAGMNPITFGTKRAYHGFLRLTRRAFASVGITAARFDMLLTIRGSVRTHDPWGDGIAQSELWRLLGVSRSVVSRMLKALEAMGLVWRYEIDVDLRHRWVTLSDKGEAVFRAARDLLMRSVQRVVVAAVCFGRRCGEKEQRGRQLELANYLAALRVHFGDKAPLGQDWTQLTPMIREIGPPAMRLRDWSPAAA